MTGLVVDGLDVEIDGSPILHDVALEVADGRFCVVVGPSGCGKSTLLRTIAGLRRSTRGRIALGDETLGDEASFVPPERRRIGWVPQDASLFPHLTVAQNVAFGRAAMRRRGRDRRVDELLALTGVVALADRYPDQLSGGQRQRVALARALAAEPRALLLDEPFAALDPRLRGELRQELRGLLGSLGVTAMLVTHDQAEALELADTVVVMREGGVEQQGTPTQVYRRPASLWAATFLGEVVLLDASARGAHASTPLGPVALSAETAGPAVVMLRPEQLALSRDTSAGIAGRVERVRYGGHDALVELALRDGGSVLARVQAGDIPAPGDEVGIRVRGTGVAYPPGSPRP